MLLLFYNINLLQVLINTLRGMLGPLIPLVLMFLIVVFPGLLFVIGENLILPPLNSFESSCG